MNPAVRHPKGACIEESNCDWERATLCAFSNATTADRVSFLACMDDSNGEENSRRLLGGGGGGKSALNAGVSNAPRSLAASSLAVAVASSRQRDATTCRAGGAVG